MDVRYNKNVQINDIGFKESMNFLLACICIILSQSAYKRGENAIVNYISFNNNTGHAMEDINEYEKLLFIPRVANMGMGNST